MAGKFEAAFLVVEFKLPAVGFHELIHSFINFVTIVTEISGLKLVVFSITAKADDFTLFILVFGISFPLGVFTTKNLKF